MIADTLKSVFLIQTVPKY